MKKLSLPHFFVKFKTYLFKLEDLGLGGFARRCQISASSETELAVVPVRSYVASHHVHGAPCTNAREVIITTCTSYLLTARSQVRS